MSTTQLTVRPGDSVRLWMAAGTDWADFAHQQQPSRHEHSTHVYLDLGSGVMVCTVGGEIQTGGTLP